MKRTDSPLDTLDETANLTGTQKAYGGHWYQFVHEPECRAITDATWKATARINEIAKNNRFEAMQELKKLCPNIHETADIVFPFVLDYPQQLHIGKKTFINMGFLHLSGGKLDIGKNCFIGPNCHFYTPNHHITDVNLRRDGWQYDAPIIIGDDCWLGGDVIVCPGVTIGRNVVVGAGSVVTKDIPDDCIVAGNPARPIKRV